ncbi:MAG: UMP kinase [Candidatus Pacearchaeota archaeon]|nr:UMP kinase [Candidatus Pacearchaeota archaeon]
MKKQVIVISLGGSLIIPDDINLKYLKSFRKVILKNKSKYKFIIVCGGGNVARTYISALREMRMSMVLQSYAGISATRMNARFMSYFFKQDQERGIPHKISELKEYANKFDIVFCGALEYKPHQTSDSTSAQIAEAFRCKFVNLTNVKGLHDKNPFEHKDARFIPKISWEDFDKMANQVKFQPGQHFVLDETASGIIKKNKIATYILGKDVKQLDRLLNGKEFIGTIIQG